MKRVLWSSLAVACVCAAVVVVGLAWKGRADDICRERAPTAAGDYSVTWDWDAFAYVCDYRAPTVKPRRVGIIDAFHGDERRRHGLDRSRVDTPRAALEDRVTRHTTASRR